MNPYVIPDVNTHPAPESYDYYGVNGLPYSGPVEPLSREEYRARVATTCRVGFGNFDTAKPEEVHSGRTLSEVLVKGQTGEYRILLHREQWVQCPKLGVRVLQFLQWAEFSERLSSEAKRASTRQAANAKPIVNTFMQAKP